MDIGRSGGSSCGTATSFALYVPLTNTSGRPWTLRSVEAGAARDVDLEDTVIAVVSAAGTSRDRLAGFQGLTVTYTEGDAEKKVTVDDAVWGAHPDISDACGTAPNRVTAG